MVNGGELMVLAKEWWMIVRLHDGVWKSDGRGCVSSKYSWGLSSQDWEDLIKRSVEGGGKGE